MYGSDEEIIAACRSGNDDAWETLVRKYRRLVYAIPRRAGFDEDDSGEIFQQTFTILFRNIGRLRQPGQIQAWLVTTARRETIRLIKKRRIERQMASDRDEDHFDEDSAIPDNSFLPDEELLRIETQNRVRIAVESLDDKCRSLLEMLFYFDPPLAYSVISKRLGISEGSVGPTRARCLEKTLIKLSG